MDGKEKIQKALKLVAVHSIERCSQLFSKMIKKGAKIGLENVRYDDITVLSQKIMEKGETEVVASFIDLVGEAPFKFLFYVQTEDSYVLTDLILRREVGSTKEFDQYTSSAVQELGNILASATTNIFVRDFGVAMKPSPPVVVKEYLTTIFQEYIMSLASERNEILIMECTFVVVGQDINCQMFILPLSEGEKTLEKMVTTLMDK